MYPRNHCYGGCEYGCNRIRGKQNTPLFSLNSIFCRYCSTVLNGPLAWYFRMFPMSLMIFSLWFIGRMLCLGYWPAAWPVSIQTGLLGGMGSVCTPWQRETWCTLWEPGQSTLWFLPAPLACTSFPWRPGERQDGSVKWFLPGSYSDVCFPVLTSCLQT